MLVQLVLRIILANWLLALYNHSYLEVRMTIYRRQNYDRGFIRYVGYTFLFVRGGMTFTLPWRNTQYTWLPHKSTPFPTPTPYIYNSTSEDLTTAPSQIHLLETVSVFEYH